MSGSRLARTSSEPRFGNARGSDGSDSPGAMVGGVAIEDFPVCPHSKKEQPAGVSPRLFVHTHLIHLNQFDPPGKGDGPRMSSSNEFSWIDLVGPRIDLVFSFWADPNGTNFGEGSGCNQNETSQCISLFLGSLLRWSLEERSRPTVSIWIHDACIRRPPVPSGSSTILLRGSKKQLM